MTKYDRKNLIAITDMSEEQQREFQSKGGKAAQKARKEKKQFKELLEVLLQSKINDQKAINQIKTFLPDINEEDLNYKMLANVALFKRAAGNGMGANTAYALLRDTVGEKPIDKQELTGADGNPLQINMSQEELRKTADEFAKKITSKEKRKNF